MITIQRLIRPNQIENAGILLHEIYIEQMNWKFNPDNPSKIHIRTNDNKKILTDRFTNKAIWFGAFDKNILVGCIRLCGIDENGQLEVESYPSSKPIHDDIPDKTKKTVFEITKLATKRSYAGKGIVKKLFLACFKHCQENHASVIACTHNGYLKSLFKKIEFPLIKEQIFKYEEQDSYPVNFYVADYEKFEISTVTKNLEYLENDISNNASKIFKALETVEPILPTPFYWMDINGTVLGINELCLKAIGSSRDIIGKKPYDFYKKEIADHILKHNAQVIQSGEILSQEEWIEDITTKKMKCFSSIKAPLYDDEGRIIGIVGTSVEITAEKESEQLRLETKLNEEKTKTATMLAASIAHELRTPLAMINILAGETDELMKPLVKTYKNTKHENLTESHLGPRQLENALTIAEQLRKTAYSANIFINMMLMQVNLEQTKATELFKLSMKKSISEAITAYPFKGKDIIRLEWNKTENPDFDFMGEQTLFNHILFNLFKNAIYHISSTENGIIKIWLETGKKHNYLHFMDTGTGISEEVLPHIFEKFYTKTKHGNGVGLALCKMIINEFGGEISCTSIIKEHTHFTLKFPAIKEK